ncbi:hypothetical protein GCM10017567_46940 [Amycolatopsis bullii]|uniref:Secreted protein n=1 Tax=Amycolatopsis bullii TaxID=941987 RepID=A0ABQ3KFU1_9PSEU|nr:hypothetical protein GCM10017567_46940 [Amycolatopsis bullii]
MIEVAAWAGAAATTLPATARTTAVTTAVALRNMGVLTSDAGRHPAKVPGLPAKQSNDRRRGETPSSGRESAQENPSSSMVTTRCVNANSHLAAEQLSFFAPM